ncbi:MAK10-like protein [Sarcoptes scabiei]|nr:MAK10-like protein [Sarcoptes scabiei]
MDDYNRISSTSNQSIRFEENDIDDDETDPFSLKCRIPLPNFLLGEGYTSFFDASTFIKRRNERERTRVRNVNDGFERLQNHLPLLPNQRYKRLSKVETLRTAIAYIKHLESLLGISPKDKFQNDCRFDIPN